MPADMTNLSEEAQSLSRVPLFKRLEPHELEHLAEEVDQVNYKAGETIFNEHDRGDALYILEEGAVRIWVYDEDVKDVTLAQLKPGDFFGLRLRPLRLRHRPRCVRHLLPKCRARRRGRVH